MEIVLLLILAYFFIIRPSQKAKAKRRRQVPSYSVEEWGYLCAMTPTQFEAHCAAWLDEHGYRTELTGRGGDGNIDILVNSGVGDRIGFGECKHHRGPVGPATVKVLEATLRQHGVENGWLFSLNGFTDGARGYVDAVQTEITLISGREMAR